MAFGLNAAHAVVVVVVATGQLGLAFTLVSILEDLPPVFAAAELTSTRAFRI